MFSGTSIIKELKESVLITKTWDFLCKLLQPHVALVSHQRPKFQFLSLSLAKKTNQTKTKQNKATTKKCFSPLKNVYNVLSDPHEKLFFVIFDVTLKGLSNLFLNFNHWLCKHFMLQMFPSTPSFWDCCECGR